MTWPTRMSADDFEALCPPLPEMGRLTALYTEAKRARMEEERLRDTVANLYAARERLNREESEGVRRLKEVHAEVEDQLRGQLDELEALVKGLEGLLRRCAPWIDHAHDCLRRAGGEDGECDCAHSDPALWVDVRAAIAGGEK